MRSVLTSRVEDVERIESGVSVYRLTNGLCWAGPEAGVEVFAGDQPRATLLVQGGAFFLRVEGMDGPVPVRLVACRRKVWDSVLWREMVELAVL